MTIGFVVTAFLFLALPLTQLISVFSHSGEPAVSNDFALEPPPPPPEEPPPPPEEEKEEEKPELETKPNPLSLAQLEVALNPGNGGASGDFGFGSFNADIKALDEMDIFELADLDTKPRPRNRIAPVYPTELRKRGITGWARIIFIVDENGRVRYPRIDSSSQPEFEKPCLDAVLQWTFEPGLKDGKAVKTRMMLPLRFSL